MDVLKMEKKSGRLHYFCRCSCGVEKWFLASNVATGKSKSCGCKKLSGFEAKAKSGHGKSKTKVHNIWMGMHQRCYNKNNPHYADYGGRGITVCESWHQFDKFYADMGDPPEGLTLDRRGNNKGYSPSNCRWATNVEQIRNRRNAIQVTLDGETKSLLEWCELKGVKYTTVYARLQRGKSAKESLN